MNERRVYVPVVTAFDADGRMIPRSLTWEDGTTYEIDRVIDVCPAATVRAGAQGDRFTVEIDGRRKHLFFQRSMAICGNQLGKWFVERK